MDGLVNQHLWWYSSIPFLPFLPSFLLCHLHVSTTNNPGSKLKRGQLSPLPIPPHSRTSHRSLSHLFPSSVALPRLLPPTKYLCNLNTRLLYFLNHVLTRIFFPPFSPLPYSSSTGHTRRASSLPKHLHCFLFYISFITFILSPFSRLDGTFISWVAVLSLSFVCTHRYLNTCCFTNLYTNAMTDFLQNILMSEARDPSLTSKE